LVTQFFSLVLLTFILPVVLYGRETLSLTLKEKHKTSMFENSVLGRIFALKRDEEIGCWRKLHNDELHNLYCSPSIIIVLVHTFVRFSDASKLFIFHTNNQEGGTYTNH
jgi:hypothetical protein